MGKKGSERSKTKTSSSSGASSLLGSTGFIGFSDVLPTGPAGNALLGLGGGGEAPLVPSVPATPFYAGDDSDLNVICKRLGKKDSITKLKALADLVELLRDRPAATVDGLLPFWLYIFPRLVLLDNDRRVREAVCAGVLPQLLACNRRAVVSVLGRQLLGPWYCAINDPCREVAAAAVRALECAFPKAKRRDEVVSQAAPLLLAHMLEQLQHRPDTLSDPATSSAEEMDERFERVVGCVLTALAALIQSQPDPVNARLHTPQTLTEEPGADSPAFLMGGVSYSEVLREEVVWRLLGDGRASFRRAAYGVLTAACLKLGPLLRQTGQVSRLAQHMCSVLGVEKEGMNHSSMWEAVLVFFHAFPRAWGGAGGNDLLRSQFLPRLTRLIRAHFLGSAAASCPSLLPLLAQLPPDLACAASCPCAYLEVMEALTKAARGDAKDGPAPYLCAVLELSTYLLLRPDPPPAMASIAAPLLDQAVAVVKAAVGDEAADAPQLREALTTSIMQAERGSREAARACLLRQVEGSWWSSLRDVLAAALDTTGHGKGWSGAQVVADVVCRAHDKLGPAPQGSSRAGGSGAAAGGLEGLMSSLFRHALDRCQGGGALGGAHQAYLSLMHDVAIRLGPALLEAPQGSVGEEEGGAPPLLSSSFCLPALTATLASQPSSPALPLLTELTTLAALNQPPGQDSSDSGPWLALLQAASQAGMAALLTVLRAVASAHQALRRRQAAAVSPASGTGGVPASLSSLLSPALEPMASALLCPPSSSSSPQDAPVLPACSSDRDRVAFLSLVLGAGLLSGPAASSLVARILDSHSAVGLEGLLEALTPQQQQQQQQQQQEAKEEGGAVAWGSRRTCEEVLVAAFLRLGAKADARVRAALGAAGGEEARAAFAEACLAALQAQVASMSEEAGDVAGRLARLAHVLAGSQAWAVPTLLRRTGLTDASAWRSARRGDARRWGYLWSCLAAFLGQLPPSNRLAALQEAGGDGQQPDAAGLELVVEVLRAGVELGGRPGGEVEAEEETGPALTSFLSASHPLTTGGAKDEPSPRAFALLLPSVSPEQAVTVVELVERGLRLMVEGRAEDWRAAYLVMRLLARLHTALRLSMPGPVNEEALTPVLLPREKAGMFSGVGEVGKGAEVWWLDKKDTSGGGWRRGVVVGVHTDDEEKYFTIAKATGGETQTELARLRKFKPPDVAPLVQAVCRDLPHWAHRKSIAGGAAAVAAIGEAGPALPGAVEAAKAAIRRAAEAALEREDVALAWAVARAVGTMGLLGPALGTEEEGEWQEWEQATAGRCVAVALAALQASPVPWPRLAAALYLLAPLAARHDRSKQQELWARVREGGALLGRWQGQEGAVPDRARVALLAWMEEASPGGEEGAAVSEEELWSEHAEGAYRATGLALAVTQAGLRRVLLGGSGSLLSGQIKADLFRLGLKGVMRRGAATTAGAAQGERRQAWGLLEHDLLRHCRLLAVSLIPADNKGLDWTTFIYADPHAHGPDVVLNEPLWNAHVGALLQALEVEALGEGGQSLLHVSLLHLLRPYLRSSLRSPDEDEEEEEEEEDESKKPSSSSKGGQRTSSLVDTLMDLAGAEGTDAAEAAELRQDLRAVERRLPPRLHALLLQAIVGGGSPSTGPSLRDLCGGSEEWAGLLEALGGSEDEWLHLQGGDEEEEDEGQRRRRRQQAVEVVWRERRRLSRHLLAWVLLLEHVEGVALSGRLRDAYSAYVGAMGAVPLVMQACFRLLRRPCESVPDLPDLWRLEPGLCVKDLRQLAVYGVFRTITAFPALVRKWWSTGCDRALAATISRFVEEHVSGRIMQREMELLSAKEGWGTADDDQITVKGSTVTREVSATYLKDECTLEVVIRLPLAYPLRNVEVECTRSMGISADKWKRWQLQIVTLLSMRDGSIVDAVGLWVRNLDKAFEGVEPCPICYSILQPKNMTLPQRECRTCHNKFHDVCVYKWFSTSNKNKCPLCQQATL